MGLLDDAIREHLELKRRRGADPEEVAREQREALDVATGRGGAVPQRRLPTHRPATRPISRALRTNPAGQIHP